MTPPLRFLVLVIGGWTAARAALFASAWWVPPPAIARPPAAALPSGSTAAQAPLATVEPDSILEKPEPAGVIRLPLRPERSAAVRLGRLASVPGGRPSTSLGTNGPLGRAFVHPQAEATRPPFSQPRSDVPRRWSLSAWAFVRAPGASALAPGGSLGGSQAGVRATYRLMGLRRPLALSARFYAPTSHAGAAEAALGLDWKPSALLPLHLLAERRQAIGREGRSAFGLTLYGGVSDARLADLRIDAYGQAGVVGTRSRDAFAEGSIKLSLPLGRGKIGLGAWAAAQPGLSRADVGPTASLRLPLAGRTVTVAADWRLRVAGDAEPGSGPALTLATDF